MTLEPALLDLAPTDRAALARAVEVLEKQNFAARLADYSGQPINRLIGMLPKVVNDRIAIMVRTAVMKGLNVAIESLEEDQPPAPATWFSSFLAGVTGGVGGMFGTLALPIELPLTTTFMLRAIADIARHEGEDLSRIEARLACLEVFGLGSRRTDKRMDVGYYTARALLGRYTNNIASLAVEHGVTGASAPAVNGLVAEIVARFGLVVSDKVAATALPVLGAIGGATINIIFMDHFQRIAKGHFTLRRLERHYGADRVRLHYDTLLKRGQKSARSGR